MRPWTLLISSSVTVGAKRCRKIRNQFDDDEFAWTLEMRTDGIQWKWIAAELGTNIDIIRSALWRRMK